MAVERRKLQNLIFDNQLLLRSHRDLAAVLGGVLRLPPIKKAPVLEQVKPRYLQAWSAVSPGPARGRLRQQGRRGRQKRHCSRAVAPAAPFKITNDGLLEISLTRLGQH
jgi:hypothetical protein